MASVLKTAMNRPVAKKDGLVLDWLSDNELLRTK
jgi:hypothetical protein